MPAAEEPLSADGLLLELRQPSSAATAASEGSGVLVSTDEDSSDVFKTAMDSMDGAHLAAEAAAPAARVQGAPVVQVHILQDSQDVGLLNKLGLLHSGANDC